MKRNPKVSSYYMKYTDAVSVSILSISFWIWVKEEIYFLLNFYMIFAFRLEFNK